MEYLSTKDIKQQTLIDLFNTNWGSDEMIISTGTYQLSKLPGIAAYEDGQILGIITYKTYEDHVEIISLDSFLQNKGIGSKLLKSLEQTCEKKQITRITVITTNDNINALKFYQKRGYRIKQVLPNAVEKARQLKPTIPLVAENGIAIKDEIELEKRF
ncbi:GNAT family N-acetyltransferase [Mammaliicoccus vitulinus]|uniref:GNAT family N-acetyltransferase n=1 Tax=Mammaliicoccus vitulinus TaxID=71237 RepID=A0A2T4PWV8_9STAP|nr:GNAT family N-acetyltransferase [Mammaliicoccus vitulinus]PTI30972.1 GNAT family N-acetyltransferase [Mammaliicoccus vitulinus]RIN25507.1 GNAT family N-acetyltransferase [Mammaliicoccus vitulinus]